MKHKLKSRLPGEIAIISDIEMTPHLWQKAKNSTFEFYILNKVKKESEKVGLKLNIQITKIVASGPITS